MAVSIKSYQEGKLQLISTQVYKIWEQNISQNIYSKCCYIAAVIIFEGIIWPHVSISYIGNNNMADARKFKVKASTVDTTVNTLPNF
jgi:hypothetical protein